MRYTSKRRSQRFLPLDGGGVRWGCILVLLLIAFPVSLHAKTRVAVMELGVKAGVEESTARLLTDTLRTSIYNSGIFDMLNREDMVDILGEVKFQQSGACEDTSCIVALGGNLGVEKMVAGTVGLIGEDFSVTLKLVDIAKAKNDVIISDQYRGKLEKMPEFINRLADELVEKVLSKEDIKRHSAKKALLLGLLPGAGHWYNGKRSEALKFAVLGGTTLASGLIFMLSAADAEDKYEVEKERADFQFLSEQADEDRMYSMMFFGGFGAVVCWSVLDSYLTGKQLEGKVEVTHSGEEMRLGYACKF